MPPTPEQNPPVADNTTPAATPTPAPQVPAPQVPAPDAGQGAAPVAPANATSVAGPAPAGPAQPPPAWTEGHGAKHVLGEIFQTLAGGQKIVYTQGPNGPVKTYQDLKPGEMARGILAAAITGLASGYDPANRGKGPAMASAFASGYKGEDQERKGLEAKKEQDAQQEFTNNNLAEDRKMKLAEAAQRQQEGAQRILQIGQMMEQAKVKASQEQTLFDQNQLRILHQNDLDFHAALINGKIVQDPSNPGKNLVMHTWDEAQHYISNHPELTTGGGEFDTIPYQLPGTGGFVMVKTPLSADEKVDTYFAKRDPNTGELLRDPKTKKLIPTGQPGADGNIIQPGQMTGAQAKAKIKESDEYVENHTSWREKNSVSAKNFADAEKEDSITKANKSLADAGNDPAAIDIYTGFPKMPLKQRETLAAFYSKASQELEMNANNMRKQLDLATGDEARELRAAIKEADDKDKQYGTIINSLNPKIKPETALANYILDHFGGDAKKASAFFEEQAKKGSYNGAQLDLNKVRTGLAAAVTQAQQQTAAEEKAKTQQAAENKAMASLNPLEQNIVTKLKGQPADVVAQQLDLHKVEYDERVKIYQGLGLTPPPHPKREAAGAGEIKAVAGSLGYFLKHPNEIPSVTP